MTADHQFDNGKLTGLDPKMFGFTREEVKEPDLLAVSYLVVHPKGTLMFDAGVIPDADFKSDGTPVTEGIASATHQLKPQAKASRAKVALLMKETGAALWIEHDIATHAKLPKAPKFVE